MNIELTKKDIDILLKALSALSDYMKMSYSNQEKFRREHNKLAKISNKIFNQTRNSIDLHNLMKEVNWKLDNEDVINFY